MLGFGSQLGAFGWVFAVAAAMGLIAKENVIGAFLTMAAVILTAFQADPTLLANSGILSAEVIAELEALIASGEFGEDGYEVVAMIAATGITWQGLIAFIVFNMSTIPCFAAVAAARGELGKGKKIKMTVLFWVVTSYLATAITYVVLTWWWTVFIVLALAAVVVWLIVRSNKSYKKKSA